MELIEWVKARLDGSVEPLGTKAFDLPGLRVEPILNTHINWLANWKKLLRKEDVSALDASIAGDAGSCAMGVWLVNARSRIGASLQYARVLQRHEEFHQLAQLIVTLQAERQFTEVLELSRSDLPDAILGLAEALEDLKGCM